MSSCCWGLRFGLCFCLFMVLGSVLIAQIITSSNLHHVYAWLGCFVFASGLPLLLSQLIPFPLSIDALVVGCFLVSGLALSLSSVSKCLKSLKVAYSVLKSRGSHARTCTKDLEPLRTLLHF